MHLKGHITYDGKFNEKKNFAHNEFEYSKNAFERVNYV